jgi:hypothetical protein
MKHTSFFLLSAAVVGIALSSCKKYLEIENPSTISEKQVFETVTNTNSAVVGVYAMLVGDNGYGSRVSTLFPQSADDFKTSGDYNPADRRGISTYGASADNSDLPNPFLQLFRGIERANLCIKYIPQSTPYNSGSAADKAAMRRSLGEALTLRAQFYYEAIRNWGDLPAQFVPAEDLVSLNLPKTDQDSLYNQLLADLAEAEDMVPWRLESGTPDLATRVTKAYTKGLRARIALARGGYKLNGTTHTMQRTADYKSYYQIALEECKEIIDHPEQHDLNPVYENIFKSLHTATRTDPTHEMIFEVGAYGSNASTDSKLGYYNGLRHNTSARFGGGGGGINAIPTYFYEFDSIGDIRRDVTLNLFEIDANSKKIANTAAAMTDGKFRRSWTAIGGTSQNLAVNWPILRFADILLMYAEADNEVNGSPSAPAKTALDKVRRRAFVGNEGRMAPIPGDNSGFFNAIVQERLLEFGGEGIRKYDLIRWNMLSSKIVDTRAKLTEFMNGTGRYANLPLYIYTKPADYNVLPTAQEMATMDLFGGPVSKVLFEPGLGSTTAPAGYTAKAWRAAVNQDYITGDLKGYARYFEANKKEVFPIPTSVLLANNKLTQNFGY